MSRISRRASDGRDFADEPPAASTAQQIYAQASRPLYNAQVQALLSGGFAGIVSRTAVAPLERVKLLLQVQSISAQGQPPRYTTIGGSLADIIRREGLAGLWRGNSANCIRVFPSSALQFMCYGELKLRLYGGREDLHPFERLAAGGLAGACAQTATYPLDLIRARLTVDLRGEYSGGMWRAMAQVARSEGVLALYRGIVPSIMGIVPYVGIDFAVYDTLKQSAMIPRRSDNGEPTVAGKLGAGAIAGAAGQTAAYPLDTVRRILQVQDQKLRANAADKYDGMIDCMVRLVRRDGVSALYRGLFANYLKVVPSVSMAFVVYEQTKAYLEQTFPRAATVR